MNALKPTAQAILIGLVSLAGIVLLFLSGCGSTQIESPLAEHLDTLNITVGEIRQRNLERVGDGAVLIESASDSIIHSSTDARIRKNAITWKLYAVPSIRQALLFADPIAAALDGWAFSVQMRQYLETGDGKELFGDHQEVAIRAAHSVEFLFDDAMGKTVDPQRRASVQNRIEEWAMNHPIKNPLYERSSIIPFLVELNVVEHGSVASAVGSIAQTTQDLSDHLNVFATQLPREGRWQAEYLMNATGIEDHLDSLELQVALMSATGKRMAKALEDGSIDIDIKSFKHLQDEIERLKEELRSERKIILADVDRQRLETLDRIQQTAALTVEDASRKAADLIDHLTWRLIEILLLGIVVLGILLVTLKVLQRRAAGAEHRAA